MRTTEWWLWDIQKMSGYEDPVSNDQFMRKWIREVGEWEWKYWKCCPFYLATLSSVIVLMKGETREATKGFDAAGEYAGVWAPSSSWRLPGVKMLISQPSFGFLEVSQLSFGFLEVTRCQNADFSTFIWFPYLILTSHQRRERKPKVYAAYGGKRWKYFFSGWMWNDTVVRDEIF